MVQATISPPRHDPKVNKALRNFAISITVFNILGYTVFGFEQAWTWPFIALATGYGLEIVLEIIGARSEGRPARFRGNGIRGVIEFLYPAHITSLALNMLIYVNDQVLAMMFGVAVAIGAKWVLRAPVRGRMRHFMNPSNFGITAILLVFPWSSVAPPYHFTEHLTGAWDWVLPLVIIFGGTMINGMLTGRMWLILGWVSAFALQAIVRGLVLDTSIPAALAMMTGVAFVLFTNYMITDPGTTPPRPAAQVAFGAGVAVVYGVLTGMSIPYGIFFATAIVCLIRGGYLWALHFANQARLEREAAERAAPPQVTEPDRPDPSSNGRDTSGRESADREVVRA
ncbi:enediyne biosynthesis protein [Micromonospora sp. NPDC051543]|uniref:enediyne biosynthesis protein n=1 Tax=Micromonospora sp. NPDC051543 TaxID=3364287 RepID=UPI0037B86522